MPSACAVSSANWSPELKLHSSDHVAPLAKRPPPWTKSSPPAAGGARRTGRSPAGRRARRGGRTRGTSRCRPAAGGGPPVLAVADPLVQRHLEVLQGAVLRRSARAAPRSAGQCRRLKPHQVTSSGGTGSAMRRASASRTQRLLDEDGAARAAKGAREHAREVLRGDDHREDVHRLALGELGRSRCSAARRARRRRPPRVARARASHSATTRNSGISATSGRWTTRSMLPQPTTATVSGSCERMEDAVRDRRCTGPRSLVRSNVEQCSERAKPAAASMSCRQRSLGIQNVCAWPAPMNSAVGRSWRASRSTGVADDAVPAQTSRRRIRARSGSVRWHSTLPQKTRSNVPCAARERS